MINALEGKQVKIFYRQKLKAMPWQNQLFDLQSRRDKIRFTNL